MKTKARNTWIHLVAGALLLPCVAMAQPPSAGAAQKANAPRVKVSGPITPVHINVDVRTLPNAKPWRPGDVVRDARSRRYTTPGDASRLAPTNKRTLPDRLPELQWMWDASEAGRRANAQHKRMRTARVAIENNPGQGRSDPVVEVGPDHVIYAQNSSGGASFTIYDKAGTVVSAAKSIGSLAPSGSTCTSASSDPLVMYDRLGSRWFMQQLDDDGLCVYISKTTNPVTGGWVLYKVPVFDTGGTFKFPDFPKCGVWANAYVCSAMQDKQPVYILDRERMLAGQTARGAQVLVSPDTELVYYFENVMPATIYSKTTPAGGVKPIVARHRDDELNNGASANGTADYLDLYELTIDWTTPANTSYTKLPSVAVTEFNSWMNGLDTLSIVPQPGTTTRLDASREVLLNQLVYRHMGTHEAIVGAFATNLDPARTGNVVHAGLRWFELRRTGTGGWTLYQEGTLSSADTGTHHFMGTVGMDKSGNIGIGYNLTKTSTPVKHVSLFYNGRAAGDPLGTMTLGANEVGAGVAAQTDSSWGDYYQMTVDPVDDCTFWFVGLYRPSAGLRTRIADFKFPSCSSTPPPATYTVSGTIATSTGAGIGSVTVSARSATTGAISTATTSTSGTYTLTGLANSTYTLTPSRSGYTFTPTTRSVAVNGANVSGQNFTGAVSTSTQLLLNPGFESGATSWTASHTGIITNSTQRTARNGSWYARLGGVAATATRTLWQSVSIPSGRTSATLSYYLKIDTAESASDPGIYDRLEVQVLNSAGTSVLKSCTTYSNRDAGTTYVQRTCDLSSLIGQTVRIQFKSSEDYSLQTTFAIDDTALTVQ